MEAQADLRSFGSALRFAINAARRAPRVHGMTVSSLAAAATMPLMKRVFVFITLFLDLFDMGLLPLIEDEYGGPIGPDFGNAENFPKT